MRARELRCHAHVRHRNGGLFVDHGVLVPKDAGVLVAPGGGGAPLTVDSATIVEWRALTVALLDVVAERVRARFGWSEAQLPLAKVLEAGASLCLP